ncbi:hypothetical protein SLA2020_416990 [Shorea laevis]
MRPARRGGEEARWGVARAGGKSVCRREKGREGGTGETPKEVCVQESPDSFQRPKAARRVRPDAFKWAIKAGEGQRACASTGWSTESGKGKKWYGAKWGAAPQKNGKHNKGDKGQTESAKLRIIQQCVRRAKREKREPKMTGKGGAKGRGVAHCELGNRGWSLCGVIRKWESDL